MVRRLVILASEDVGLADPQALALAAACQQAVHFLGMPEAQLPARGDRPVYLALRPEERTAHTAPPTAARRADAERTRNDAVPMHLRNAVTPV